jgi:hypothetical protein
MILDNRIHGSPGGYLVKGGSYFDSLVNVTPGSRKEIPFFINTGPSSCNNVGFRLVISSINISSVKHIDDLTNEFIQIKKDNVNYNSNNTIKDIQTLLSQIEEPTQKNILQNIYESVKNFNEVINTKDKNTVRDNIWNLAYLLISLRTTRQHLNQLDNTYSLLQNDNKIILDCIKSQQCKNHDNSIFNNDQLNSKIESNNVLINDTEKTRQDFESSYETQRIHYERLLSNIKIYDHDLIDKQYFSILQDIKSDDFYSIELKKCLDIVKGTIDKVKSGTDSTQISSRELEFDLSSSNIFR